MTPQAVLSVAKQDALLEDIQNQSQVISEISEIRVKTVTYSTKLNTIFRKQLISYLLKQQIKYCKNWKDIKENKDVYEKRNKYKKNNTSSDRLFS